MRIGFLRLVVLVAIALTTAVPARGQDGSPQGQRRPKIGLALGGGSARGIAHVGVLRWFEEHHIPIDFIVGTSMGGLIAGAYASGMSPDEIGELLKESDWDLMFLSDSPYRFKTWRRKQDKREFPSQLEFGLKHGISLPGSLNPGQQVALLLDRIALPYGDLESFDDLPTPFRAVATDLRKGEVVVLGRPPLVAGDARHDGDPGRVRADQLGRLAARRRWHAQQRSRRRRPQPQRRHRHRGRRRCRRRRRRAAAQSLLSLLGKTIDTMMTTSTRRALASADLVIDPDLKGLGSMSWRQSDELAERGYQRGGRQREASCKLCDEPPRSTRRSRRRAQAKRRREAGDADAP